MYGGLAKHVASGDSQTELIVSDSREPKAMSTMLTME